MLSKQIVYLCNACHTVSDHMYKQESLLPLVILQMLHCLRDPNKNLPLWVVKLHFVLSGGMEDPSQFLTWGGKKISNLLLHLLSVPL